jgi:hypothetical protein
MFKSRLLLIPAAVFILGAILAVGALVLKLFPDKVSSPVLNFTIETPEQLNSNNEKKFAVGGILELVKDISASAVDVKVYVKPGEEDKWWLANAKCSAIIESNRWRIASECLTFPMEYSVFTFLAVVVDVNKINELPGYVYPYCVPATDLAGLKGEIRPYVLEQKEKCFSKVVEVRLPTPTPTLTPTPTSTSTSTPTQTPMPTPTDTPTPPVKTTTAKLTPPTSIPTPTHTPTNTLISTPTPMSISTPTGAATSTPTDTPTVTPKPTLPPPTLSSPEDGGTVDPGTLLKWTWDGELGPGQCSSDPKWGDCFSLRVWREGEEQPCFHGQLKEKEYMAGTLGSCRSGPHFWQVGVARKAIKDSEWEEISDSSDTWQFFYNKPDGGGNGGPTPGDDD